MAEPIVVTTGPDGLRRGDRPWEPPVSWVGVLALAAGDRRAELLTVAARAREERLAVVSIMPDAGGRETVLARLAALPPHQQPRGLLLGEAWQEPVAARCSALTGAAADLGLVDAVRSDEDGDWQGHHLFAGAVEAFLAQVWPEAAGTLPRAAVLGDGPLARVAALVAARRGAAAVTVITGSAAGRDELMARFAAVDWPTTAAWQVSDRLDVETPSAGIWIRATGDAVDDAIWLPDAAGDEPCVVVDLEGRTDNLPLGFVHPATRGVHVMAAGLAVAWFLGPPIPWDALTAAAD